MNIAIVIAQFNESITSRMKEIAKERAKHLNLNISHISHVPGSYDMPLIVDALLKRADVDAIVTLGAIIRGQTKHDEIIAHAIAQKLLELSIQYHKPVTLGISGPGMQERHAYARIRPVAERAVDAALTLHKELKKISK